MPRSLALLSLFALACGASSDDTGDGPSNNRSGLARYCDRYVECGGTYYADADACMDASYDYWGDCPAVEQALDDFGDCMAEIPCDDYNPDAYNPASTDCAPEWSEVGQASC